MFTYEEIKVVKKQKNKNMEMKDLCQVAHRPCFAAWNGHRSAE